MVIADIQKPKCFFMLILGLQICSVCPLLSKVNLWWSLWEIIYIYGIMPPMIQFTSSFLIQMPFYFFFLSNCSGQKRGIILNSSDENGHACFVPDPSGKHFSPSTLIRCLSVGLSSVPFIMLRKFLSIHVFLCFHHERVSDFIECRFCIY